MQIRAVQRLAVQNVIARVAGEEQPGRIDGVCKICVVDMAHFSQEDWMERGMGRTSGRTLTCAK